MSEPSERLAEVGRSFLRLGCTAFGGPSAHFASYRDEFVVVGAGSTRRPTPSCWR